MLIGFCGDLSLQRALTALINEYAAVHGLRDSKK